MGKKSLMGSLEYDEATEEGVVDIDWDKLPGNMVGLDILSDWILGLTDIYNLKVKEVYRSVGDEI
jgi:hypothetical protein